MLKLLQTCGKAHENALMLLFQQGFFEWQSDYSIQLAACWSHFLYFEISASGSSKWQWGFCVLRPSLQPQCCLFTFLFHVTLRHSFRTWIQVDIFSDTQAMSATRMLIRGQLEQLSLGPFKHPHSPSFPLWMVRWTQAHIEIQGVTMVLLLNWTLWMAWEASRQWFSIPAAQRNPTIQGHAENEDRTNAYPVLTINTDALVGVPHIWIWNFALPHLSIVTLVTIWFSLWQWFSSLKMGLLTSWDEKEL